MGSIGVPYSCSLSNDLSLRAQKELHEKPEWRERDIDALRSLVRDIPDLHADLSDNFLIRFLRSCKFDYDCALHLLLQYYAVRRRYPELFELSTPAQLLYILKSHIFAVLNQCDYHGARLLIVDLKRWAPDVYSPNEITSALLLMCEWLSSLESVQVTGITVIVDLRTLPITAVWRKEAIRKLIACTQKSLPLRMKAVHVLHDSYLWNAMIIIIKSLFVSDKIKQRLHFHGHSLQSLQQYLDLENVPRGFDLGDLGISGGCSSLHVGFAGSRDLLLDNPLPNNPTDQHMPPPDSTSITEPIVSHPTDYVAAAEETLEQLMACETHFSDQRQFGFTGDSPGLSRLSTSSSVSGWSVDERRPSGCHLIFANYKKLCIDSFN